MAYNRRKNPRDYRFAVGRTIFWEPLVDHKEGKTIRKVTVEKIAHNYQEFTELWLNERKGKKEKKK
jgi:myo-inositol catabolism protein IolC